jgi:hypothetical protein
LWSPLGTRGVVSILGVVVEWAVSVVGGAVFPLGRRRFIALFHHPVHSLALERRLAMIIWYVEGMH